MSVITDQSIDAIDGPDGKSMYNELKKKIGIHFDIIKKKYTNGNQISMHAKPVAKLKYNTLNKLEILYDEYQKDKGAYEFLITHKLKNIKFHNLLQELYAYYYKQIEYLLIPTNDNNELYSDYINDEEIQKNYKNLMKQTNVVFFTIDPELRSILAKHVAY
jgi:hypothetical protein